MSGPPKRSSASSRLIDWTVCAIALSAAAVALLFGNAIPRSGSPISVEITVVPSDAANLACASDDAISDTHCGFDNRGTERAQAPLSELRPYVTTRRELVLLAGVFEEPHVVAWRTEATNRRTEQRVTIRCTANYLGETGPVRIRWLKTQGFNQEHSLLVSRVRTCTVTQG